MYIFLFCTACRGQMWHITRNHFICKLFAYLIILGAIIRLSIKSLLNNYHLAVSFGITGTLQLKLMRYLISDSLSHESYCLSIKWKVKILVSSFSLSRCRKLMNLYYFSKKIKLKKKKKKWKIINSSRDFIGEKCIKFETLNRISLEFISMSSTAIAGER